MRTCKTLAAFANDRYLLKQRLMHYKHLVASVERGFPEVAVQLSYDDDYGDDDEA